MSRLVLALAILVGLSTAASAALVEDTVAVSPSNNSSSYVFTAGPGTTLEILGGFAFNGVGTVTLTDSTNLAVLASEAFTGLWDAATSASFANAFALMAGNEYMIGLVMNPSGIGSVGFQISQVPVPGAVLLFGTALAGLAAHRRVRAA